jgi:hypothetical protein
MQFSAFQLLLQFQHFRISAFQRFPKPHSVPVNSQARFRLARDLLAAHPLLPFVVPSKLPEIHGSTESRPTSWRSPQRGARELLAHSANATPDPLHTLPTVKISTEIHFSFRLSASQRFSSCLQFQHFSVSVFQHFPYAVLAVLP